MPEEVEFEAREEQQSVEEAAEAREKAREARSAWTRWISLSTALLAVVAAVAALQSGSLVNEALVKKNESVLKQAQASDSWAYYQAKGIKSSSAQETAQILALSPNPAGAQQAARWQAEAARLKSEQGKLSQESKKLEAERDDSTRESNELMEQHHLFAYCVTFTQVAIALSAIAALTGRRPVWYLSLLIGLVGLGLLVSGFLHGAAPHVLAQGP